MRNQVEPMSTTFLCGIDQEELKNISSSGSDLIGLELGKSVGNIGLSITHGELPTTELSLQAQDLIEIAAYLYQSDRLVARNMDAWTRYLNYHVAVRDLDRWRDLELLLNRLASFLSGDRIKFHFYAKRNNTNWIPRLPVPDGSFEGTCLYSGGMDSTSGMSWLMENKMRVVAVSQYSNRLSDRSSLLSDLGNAGGLEMPLIGFRLVPRRTRVAKGSSNLQIDCLKDVDFTWRLRTFFYLSIGAATAQALGLEKVYMFENGILAHNLPFDRYVIGARSTRHAHPTFLEFSQALFEKLFEQKMRIVNPFQFYTKGFEAHCLGELSSMFQSNPSLVARTNSCWYFPNMVARLSYSSTRKITHCGGCMPCKIRRLAIYEANLQEREPVENQYFVDPLSAPIRCKEYASRPTQEKFVYDQHCRNIVRVKHYAERILNCKNLREFSREWPQVFEFEGKNLSGRPVPKVITAIYDLYTTFADHLASMNGTFN
jgi:7-cyano-7-deazaguanine synthase in queuosine biosynthesis